MPSSPLVYVIVLNYNGSKMTLDCVRSLLRLDYPNFEVLVVDNGSTNDSVAVFRKAFTGLRVKLLVNDQNYGYAEGNNRGIERALSAGADYILILNNDTVVEPGCVSPLVEAMERDSKLGICGGPIRDAGFGSRPNCGHRVGLFTGHTALWPDRGPARGSHEVDGVSGAAIFLRTETIRGIGMFDCRFFLSWEETDLCYRARGAGYKVCFVPGPGVQHWIGQSSRERRPLVVFCGIRNRAWFNRRHGRLKHRLVFNVLSFCYFYPRTILGRIIRREFELIGPILRGIWEGHRGYPGLHSGSIEAPAGNRLLGGTAAAPD